MKWESLEGIIDQQPVGNARLHGDYVEKEKLITPDFDPVLNKGQRGKISSYVKLDSEVHSGSLRSLPTFIKASS